MCRVAISSLAQAFGKLFRMQLVGRLKVSGEAVQLARSALLQSRKSQTAKYASLSLSEGHLAIRWK
jgi:hypothetical protein